jgi:hypothetical protein
MREMMSINLCPRTAWLNSVFNKHLPVDACFSELFDNAFDQDATIIEVTTGPDSITVLDNGRGIANMENMLAFSEKPLTPRPRVGRYGVGGKYGAINLGSQLEVDSRHGISRQRAFIDWEAMREQGGSWEQAIEVPHPSKGESFTKLTISRLHKNKLERLPSALPKLARIYRPALESGKRILINGDDLQPAPLPKFATKPRRLDGHFNGKHYRLTFGIRADETPHKGYDVAYMYRVIAQNDTSGFGPYSPMRVYGWLELLNDADDWTLSELKSIFAERDELYAHLLPQIEDILIEAQERSDSIALENTATVLNERLRALGMIGTGPKRSDPTGQERGPYERHDPPLRKPQKPRTLEDRLNQTGYIVKWDEKDPRLVGEVTYSGPHGIIHLNPAYVLINEDGTMEQTEAMLSVCCALIVMDYQQRSDGERSQMRLPFDDDSGDLFITQFCISKFSLLLKLVAPKDSMKESTQEV